MSMIHSSFDLAHTLTKNDYFSDINPRSMRRFMNIVAVTGSLFILLLSYGIMSGSDITPCIIIDKTLLVYRFWY